MAYMNRSKLVVDKDVRHAFYEYIRPKLRGSMFVHELVLQLGREEGRVDLVAIDNELSGFEIKSDADTLTRLKRQVRLYSKVMHRMSLVVTLKHLAGATRIAPEYWGIYTYLSGNITEVRAPSPSAVICFRSMTGLLWKDSALQLLNEHGLDKGFARKAKHYLHEHIFEKIGSEHIQAADCRQMKSHRRSI